MGNTNFSGVTVNGAQLLPGLGTVPLTGNWYYVNPASGSDGNPGTVDAPLATLYQAHNLMTAGNNDVCVLVGNGGTSGTARLSLALAQTINPAATSGTLNWTKNACHLIGETAPTMNFQRARIAPPSGTYTVTTFGSANLVVVTAVGCIFTNFSLFHGFTTGGANQICWTDTGGRNYYSNVNFGGMGDAGSAADAGSRSLKLGAAGTGENTFVGCVIGLDTVSRGAANASLELAGGTPRNTFIDCDFPFQCSASTPLGYIGTGSSCIDRNTVFANCRFINNVQSGSTTMAGLGTLPASAGGLLYFDPTTALVGITEFGTDATTRGQCYVASAAPSATAGGIAVNPT